jgi:heme o synthase
VAVFRFVKDMTDLTANELQPAGELRDYVQLLKPRVMSLVVFTGLAGLIAAPAHLHPVLGFVAVLCIAVAAGGAGAINMWYERDVDALMTRTRGRPLPAGRVEPQEALALGVALTGFAVATMGLALNWVAAGLLALTTFTYVVVYTVWLKRRTPQNIVIGGAAGAFPPMIGWAAATGDVSLASVSLFLIIFFWTPPHFWALALLKNEDYRRAGIPMMPVVAGAASTKRQMLAYTLLLLPLGLAPWFLGAAGVAYAIGATLLGLGFVGHALWVLRSDAAKPAARMFAFSLFYLAALFALLMLDARP